ncbi:Transmembrane protein 41A [Geodia barretti]|uniref:Transmembrane protein 41A n=1 Tax=Geodia barretti TaxID=519541 RepID=A0AA35RC84_GEOBA|nr:Transmembrane protein 41A [Geodia barretti]
MLRELVGVLVTFVAATVPLYALAASLLRNGPPLSFPSDMDQLRSLASQLERLREQHYGRVLCVFSAAYLYKQTFAIPGSVFLNILGGAVFGVWVALPLVCLLSACGASLCYLLSLVFGRRLVTRYLGHRLTPLQDRVGNRVLQNTPHTRDCGS